MEEIIWKSICIQRNTIKNTPFITCMIWIHFPKSSHIRQLNNKFGLLNMIAIAECNSYIASSLVRVSPVSYVAKLYSTYSTHC